MDILLGILFWIFLLVGIFFLMSKFFIKKIWVSLIVAILVYFLLGFFVMIVVAIFNPYGNLPSLNQWFEALLLWPLGLLFYWGGD